ncbi:MAG: T9SS type A sorting domain-containing protein, partial [Saprospiraceae bacterium]|nr:T9SS type A sorting domain-containing protein [Saprospiraceae bacterium]
AEYLNGDAQLWNPDQNSSAKIFNCDDVAASPVMVEMTVWDPKLNSDWCEVELTLVNNQPDACPDGQQRASISGHIETYEGENISEVEVFIQNMKDSAYRLSMMTSNDGNYAFTDNPMYTDYQIKASKSGEDDEGVSTLDIVLIQRHILGLDEFVNPYKVIASDVNNDKRVTGTDLVVMRKLILGIYKEWPSVPVWRFVGKSDLLTVENALDDCQEFISISDLNGNMEGQNFVGLKMGDVNGTAKANARDIGLGTRSNGVLTLNIIEQQVNKGDELNLIFSSEDFNQVHGYQFTLELDGLIITGIESGDAKMNDSHIGLINNNTVTVSYSDMEGVGASDNIFTLKAIATNSGNISNMINLNGQVINSEAYVGDQLEIKGLELNVIGGEETTFRLEQNEPNPFDEVTVIGFVLPENGNATLTVYDVSGRVITNVRGNYTQGYNEIKLNKEDLNVTGVLYYTLKSGDYNATKKMIIID